MTREQIEKAAFKYACEHQIAPATGGELEKGFIDGARWRIAAVWHDASESPHTGDRIIVIDDDGHIVDVGYFGNSDRIMDGHRWAYIDDLLPERKEEAK